MTLEKYTSPVYMETYFKLFKDLIEYSYKKNDKKVFLITHGLGCNLTLLFFNYYLDKNIGKDESQKWKNTHIKSWIPVNGSFSGIPRSIKTCISGGDEGLGIRCSAYGCNEWYWEIEKMMSGLLWSFPDSNVFQNLNIITHEGKRYQLNDYKEYLLLCGNEKAIKAIDETILPIKKYSLFPPLVKTHAIIGKSRNTEIMYEYVCDDEKGDTFQNKYKPMKINEDVFYKNLKMNEIQKKLLNDTQHENMIGNGLVPYISLRTPSLWKSNGLYPNIDRISKKYLPVNITTLVGKNMGHKSMLNQQQFLDKILEIVKI